MEEHKMLSFEELTQKIKSLPAGTVIPKPESKKAYTIKGLGESRGEDALVYKIPKNDPEKHSKESEKRITFTAFYKAYMVLQETSQFTREWFNESLPDFAKDGGCNFTTIGGIFKLLGIAAYSKSGTYTRK